MAEAEAKELFQRKFAAMRADQSDNGVILARDEYLEICETIEGWSQLSSAERGQRNRDVGGKAYRWATNFLVRTTIDGAGEKEYQLLCAPKKGLDLGADAPKPIDQYLRVLHTENMYDELFAVHKQGGHAKARSLEMRAKLTFARIPRWVTNLVCETCPTCVTRVNRKVTSAGHTPIITKGMGSRGQVDLIDFQSCPDGEYKFLLNYQDHGTKYYDNRPLTCKRASAVAFALLDIFSQIGPPCLLQSDNGREFSGIAADKRHLAFNDDEVCTCFMCLLSAGRNWCSSNVHRWLKSSRRSTRFGLTLKLCMAVHATLNLRVASNA